MFTDADDTLFDAVMKNNHRVFPYHLPGSREEHYNPRQRTHNRTLISKTTFLNKQDSVIIMHAAYRLLN